MVNKTMELNYDKTAVLGDLATGTMNNEYFKRLHGLARDEYTTVITELREQGYAIEERVTDAGREWFLSDPFDALDRD